LSLATSTERQDRADPPEANARARDLSAAADALLVFRGVFADEVGAAYLCLLRAIADRASDAPAAYARAFSLLSRLAVESTPIYAQGIADPWRRHLVDRLLTDDNPLGRQARRQPDAALAEAARRDLRVLQAAYALAGDRLAEMLDASQSAFGPLQSWAGLGGGQGTPLGLAGRLAAATDWAECLPEVVEHYARFGSGEFARFRAFRWVVGTDGRGELRGVATPDPITLDDLIGYDVERELLLRNAVHFLAGRPANNVLVYGDRGTGKSSTVKALLNAARDWPAPASLRIVEVGKAHLDDFPEILAQLRGRPERFILFVDDLSFDEHETKYKELKAILEGGLEARPENVVLYATSNRRHLVQETFAERGLAGEEVHARDGIQEKLSLADRFGITATFPAPDQERYLAIVEALVRRRGLAIEEADLRRRALQWAAWHNGRSGRCARQFVDYLEGES
jgi:uncharacterized protein